jgi:predicted SAM-dependent methyltransferase
MKSYLNVGCGNKYHKDWINIDMYSNNSDVISCNLLNGIPFHDEKFEILYHSQVLEHFPKEKAFDFMKECYRVLKKNGTIRVVVPDLENIVNEYKKYLNENLKNPSKQTEANYDWILLEMYDQTVRNFDGGLMGKYLSQEKIVNEQYVIDRLGYDGRSIREYFLSGTNDLIKRNIKLLELVKFSKKILGYPIRKITKLILGDKYEKYKLGIFRLGGEPHMWMYDRYSLSRLLKDVGFRDIKNKSSFESEIPNWELYELDVKDGLAYAPKALFIEAKK